MSDIWPTTRDEWERNWPNYQSRYLAWCNAARVSPVYFNGVEYITWINQKSAAYRAERGIKGDFVPEAECDAFTAYLWGGQLELFAEAPA